MKFIDFEVYDDNGKPVETLPAILYWDGHNVIAQVPSGTTSATFTQVSNGQTTVETAINGKATFSPPSSDTYRVGNPTISKHNEITVTGIKSLADVKSDKIAQLLQSYNASFTTFTSPALGSIHTYPIDQEAQANFDRLQQRAILDTNKNYFNFKTVEDGTLVLHTRAQFLTLLQDAEAFIVAQTKHYDSLVAQVNAATDVATVEAIVW